MATFLAFIVMILVSVLFHEWGHFLAARLFGVKVERFSIGFDKEVIGIGKKIFGFKWGETDYQITPVLIGGYIKPAGPNFLEDVKPEDPENHRYMVNRPIWQRFLFMAAGPLFSFLLAVLIAGGVVGYLGKIVVGVTPVISEVTKDSPAAKAGIQTGDKVIGINGKIVDNWDKARELIGISNGKALDMEVERSGKTLNISVIPELNKEINRYVVGIAPSPIFQKVTLLIALKIGLKDSWDFFRFQAVSIWGMVTGRVSSKEIGGVVAIYKVTDQAVKAGWLEFIVLVFKINIVLAFMNLLPIPILDGGHLFLMAIEAVRRKRLSKRIQIQLGNFGFNVLILLALFALYNDLNR